MKDQDISVISSHQMLQVFEESYVEFSWVFNGSNRSCGARAWSKLQERMMNVAAIQSERERERERQREIDQAEARHATARTNKPYIYTHTHILHLHQADILTSFLARWLANDQPRGASGASARTRLRLSRLCPALLWGDERRAGAGCGGREGGPLLAVEKCGWTGCHCGGPKGYGPYQDHAHCHVALPDAGTGGWGLGVSFSVFFQGQSMMWCGEMGEVRSSVRHFMFFSCCCTLIVFGCN